MTVRLWYRRGEQPLYEEIGYGDGRRYEEVAQALAGGIATRVRVDKDGGLIVSVAVPVQRYRAVVGSLLLSTESGDIDAIVQNERMAILRVFLVAAVVTVLLSILLASTIAGPVRRLAAAAERVRRGVRHRRAEIPEFHGRKDEIGHLARVLSEMTNALYKRMEAIESFAADVSHELKNPLTSLRSAVETLPIARTDEQRNRLLAVIKHDIRRLDRLITDISDASRLDAELAREGTEAVDLGRLLETVVSIARETRVADKRLVQLKLEPGRRGKDAFYVLGHDSRLGQVFNNLIDNALSFSPPGGVVRIMARRDPQRIVVIVDDEGPGIRAENVETIFERFYTDRPEGDEFGQNSGLGLAITRQIVEAHRGTIRAENRQGVKRCRRRPLHRRAARSRLTGSPHERDGSRHGCASRGVRRAPARQIRRGQVAACVNADRARRAPRRRRPRSSLRLPRPHRRDCARIDRGQTWNCADAASSRSRSSAPPSSVSLSTSSARTCSNGFPDAEEFTCNLLGDSRSAAARSRSFASRRSADRNGARGALFAPAILTCGRRKFGDDAAPFP